MELPGLAPKLTLDGTGGTYELRDKQRNIRAMFKPIDEEAFAPNNPRGHVGSFGSESFRKGVLSGEGVIREVAAFILDSKDHFSSVPYTIFVEAMHSCFRGTNQVTQGLETSSSQYKSEISRLITPSGGDETGSSVTGVKYGSLQYFLKADDVAGNYSPTLFTKEQVHKIAILDLRILNLDRNDANILIKK